MTASRTLWIVVGMVAALAGTAPGMARAAQDDRAGQAAGSIKSLGTELLAIQAGAGEVTIDGTGGDSAATRSAKLEGLIFVNGETRVMADVDWDVIVVGAGNAAGCANVSPEITSLMMSTPSRINSRVTRR